MTTITPLLRSLAQEYPAYDARAIWNDAVEEAASADRFRSDETGETLADKLAALRSALRGEVVAFHKLLDVKPADGAAAGTKRWLVGIPLTLFPKRDQGFTRVECAIQFAARNGERFRVVEALPLDRYETLAEGGMGAELQVEASARAGAPVAVPAGSTVASAAAKVYGRGKADLSYSVRRAAVVSEILRGTGALWRMENPARPEDLAAESHSLAVIVETEDGCALDAAGYLKAYSEVQWLASNVGNFLTNLGESVRRFFASGAPVEAYGEWRDILPS